MYRLLLAVIHISVYLYYALEKRGRPGGTSSIEETVLFTVRARGVLHQEADFDHMLIECDNIHYITSIWAVENIINTAHQDTYGITIS